MYAALFLRLFWINVLRWPFLYPKPNCPATCFATQEHQAGCKDQGFSEGQGEGHACQRGTEGHWERKSPEEGESWACKFGATTKKNKEVRLLKMAQSSSFCMIKVGCKFKPLQLALTGINRQSEQKADLHLHLWYIFLEWWSKILREQICWSMNLIIFFLIRRLDFPKDPPWWLKDRCHAHELTKLSSLTRSPPASGLSDTDSEDGAPENDESHIPRL